MMDTLQNILRNFSEVFDEHFGAYKGQPVSFKLDQTVAPIWMEPHHVAFTLNPTIDA